MKYSREVIHRAALDFLAVSGEHGKSPEAYFEQIGVDLEALYDMYEALVHEPSTQDTILAHVPKDELEDLEEYIVAFALLATAVGHRMAKQYEE